MKNPAKIRKDVSDLYGHKKRAPVWEALFNKTFSCYLAALIKAFSPAASWAISQNIIPFALAFAS